MHAQIKTKDTNDKKISTENKTHVSKDSPNTGADRFLVLYSHKEKHERTKKIRKEISRRER